ncbi:MAG: DUF3467 domain-containing protein [Rikenellaceae bacterium]
MSESNNNKSHQSVELDLNEAVAQGSYANLAIISHSSSEFILDFAAILPGISKPKVNNRVILTPEHAKRLMGLLKENVSRYEQNYGAIEVHKQSAAQEQLSSLAMRSKVGEA